MIYGIDISIIQKTFFCWIKFNKTENFFKFQKKQSARTRPVPIPEHLLTTSQSAPIVETES